MTTDHILDHTPVNGIDVATFRAQEKRRVELLQARLDTEKELLALESQLADVRAKPGQASQELLRPNDPEISQRGMFIFLPMLIG